MKPNTIWDKKKYYRWTVKIPRQKWERLTVEEQETLKKQARKTIDNSLK